MGNDDAPAVMKMGELRIYEQLARCQWKGGTPEARDSIIDGLFLLFHQTTNERVKARVAAVLATFNKQNIEISLALLEASKAAAPVVEQHLHIHLGEHERRAHIDALLEEGIRNGSVLPAG